VDTFGKKDALRFARHLSFRAIVTPLMTV
jgi:hypothetical protein